MGRILARLRGLDSTEAHLRHRLVEAVYRERAEDALCLAERLGRRLGERAADDFDLAIARGWLAERHVDPGAVVAARRAAASRSRMQLMLTAVPLGAALFLTTLLTVVLVANQ